MPPEVERRLAAILTADVEGYSRLMAEDEDATVRTLRAWRGQVSALIADHRGQLADFTGDNFLAEFPTARDAVECALEIQRVIAARNDALPEARRMRFRIGVHLGDVRHEDGRLFGDGVNVAARLQSLAEPGGLCLSAALVEQVRGKLALDLEDLGPRELKNIPDRVHAYLARVSPGPVVPPRRSDARSKPMLVVAALAVAGLVAGALVFTRGMRAPPEAAVASSSTAVPAQDGTALPTTPSQSLISEKSIAVLPFTDMSEKQDQGYLGDGMAEEIINLLAQVPHLRVPARTSSFFFKDKPTQIPEIARQLGVAQVLEGSVRLAGNRVRVTAQLVRANDGYHVWSETYDRDLHDVFAIQDDIATAVVQALRIHLMGGELSRRKGGTENLNAYELYLRAMSANYENNRESRETAISYMEQATELDPSYGQAWVGLAFAILQKTESGDLDTRDGFERVRQLERHALEMSPDLAEAHAGLLYVYRTFDWDWASAESEGRKALAIDPSNPWTLMVFGSLSCTLGRWDDALQHLRAAFTGDPLNPYVMFNLATAYYYAGRYAESEAVYRQLLDVAPRFQWTRAYLGKALLVRGDPEAALAVMEQDRSDYSRLMFLPIALLAAGRQADADRALEAQIVMHGESNAFRVSTTYAYRNDRDRAMHWLERAYLQRDPGLIEIVGEPLLKNIADDPRFKAFLRKMNLPDAWPSPPSDRGAN